MLNGEESTRSRAIYGFGGAAAGASVFAVCQWLMRLRRIHSEQRRHLIELLVLNDPGAAIREKKQSAAMPVLRM